MYVLLQTLKKENGKDKTWFHMLKSSHLVKEGKVSHTKSQRTSKWRTDHQCNTPAKKGEVSMVRGSGHVAGRGRGMSKQDVPLLGLPAVPGTMYLVHDLGLLKDCSHP